jgi:hypothetical protein
MMQWLNSAQVNSIWLTAVIRFETTNTTTSVEAENAPDQSIRLHQFVKALKIMNIYVGLLCH